MAQRPSQSLLSLLLAILLLCTAVDADKKLKPYVPPPGYEKLKNIVVLYLEGWSFESLLQKYPGVDHPENTSQVSQQDFVFKVLPPPLLAPVNGSRSPDTRFPANAPVAPFDLTQYYPSTSISPPLVQRFWQEQYQINGGKMSKFVAWSDAGGLPLGYVNTTNLPLTALAMKEGSVLANVHHSVYGGGFANLMYLTCGSIPKWPNAPASTMETHGFYSVVQRLSAVTENELLDDNAVTPDGYVVNDILPQYPPLPNAPPADRLPALTLKTIGENLTDLNVTWAWYSGGWDDAMAGMADETFEYTQQPFAFFANFSPSSSLRLHLKDENEFIEAIMNNSLPTVSFVKPLGKNSGAGTLADVEEYAADLIGMLKANTQLWSGCLVIVLFTDNGGRYDSHPPPERDAWGPGTRVPAFLFGPFVKYPFVDTRSYETASLLKLFKDRYGFDLPKNITELDGFTNALNLDPRDRPGFPWWGIVFLLVIPFFLLATCVGLVWYLQHIAHAPTGWTEQVTEQRI